MCQAAEEVGCDASAISGVCKGYYKTAAGYKWAYKKNKNVNIDVLIQKMKLDKLLKELVWLS